MLSCRRTRFLRIEFAISTIERICCRSQGPKSLAAPTAGSHSEVMIFSFLPVVLFGLLVWGVIRLAGQAIESRRTDPAVLTRQVVLFGLLFVTMMGTAIGISWLLSRMSAPDGFDTNDVAESLSLLTLGIPVTAFLLYVADKRLREAPEERTSGIWMLYFTCAAAATLLGAIVNAVDFIESWVNPNEAIDSSALTKTLLWLSLWLLHWVFLQRRHGVPGDMHRAVATIMGLVPLALGQAGLTYVLAADVYSSVFDLDEFEPRAESSQWVALLGVGAAVWFTIWLRSYDSAERTTAWYVTVLPIGALAGVVAVTVSVARVLYLGAVWFFGDRETVSAAVHFEELSVFLGLGSTGAALWAYHRLLLGHQQQRTNIFRTYDYLVLFASVVSTVVGAIMVCSAIVNPDGELNLVLAGLTVLATGVAIGGNRAFAIYHHQRSENGDAELTSSVRRTYLYAMLGLGGLALLGSGVSALQGLFEALLEDRLRTQTLIDNREQIATLVFVGAAVAIHGFVSHTDKAHTTISRTDGPRAEDRHWPHRIVVLTREDDERYDHLAHPGSTVEYWHRVDPPDVPRPEDAATNLDAEVACQIEDNVLVVIQDDDPLVIPFHE